MLMDSIYMECKECSERQEKKIRYEVLSSEGATMLLFHAFHLWKTFAV